MARAGPVDLTRRYFDTVGVLSHSGEPGDWIEVRSGIAL